jgi:site-specific DNA recombinase
MSAARRKGKWTGGHPMLGYDIGARGGRLILNANEAEQVRNIFKLYLDYKAMLPVVREIDRRGWQTKQWITKRGAIQGGKPFTKGRLYRLLTNPIYTGNVEFKGQLYDGEHEAIVEPETWESVQETLHRNRLSSGTENRKGSYGGTNKVSVRFCPAGIGDLCHGGNSKAEDGR